MAPKTMEEGKDYTVKRDTSALERMWYLYHQHGIQSNLVVGATYAKDGGEKLTKSRVLDALRVVLDAQPALRTVGVQTPSKRKGKTGLAFAILHSVDVESCVEFRDDVEPGYTGEIVEALHNEWDFTEPNRPWFKLVVVGQRDVYIIYHHVIADGTSGYIFHRAFLDALNAQAEIISRSSWLSEVDPAKVELKPKLQVPLAKGREMGKPWGPAFFETIRPILTFFLLEFFVSRLMMFAELPRVKKPITQATGQAKPDGRVRTRVIINRISKETTKKMLAKCRENGTSLTALWQTASMIALTNDMYPDCWLAGNRIASDWRFHMPEVLAKEDRHAMCNRSAGTVHMERASKYRNVIKKSVDKNGDKTEEVNLETAWELARAYRRWMMAGHDAAARTMASEGLQGVDLDDFVKDCHPMVGVMSRPTTLLSNLGPLVPNEGTSSDDKNWRFVDAVFSAAPTNGEEGSRAPIYSLGGLKGADLLMVAGWQEDVASQEMAERMFKVTMERIEAMIAG